LKQPHAPAAPKINGRDDNHEGAPAAAGRNDEKRWSSDSPNA
jgi:hypothetical protein